MPGTLDGTLAAERVVAFSVVVTFAKTSLPTEVRTADPIFEDCEEGLPSGTVTVVESDAVSVVVVVPRDDLLDSLLGTAVWLSVMPGLTLIAEYKASLVLVRELDMLTSGSSVGREADVSFTVPIAVREYLLQIISI